MRIKLVLILFLIINGVFAQQELPSQRWYIGLSMGANISDMNTVSRDLQINNSTGALGGMFFQYQINEQFSVRLGAELDQRKFGMALAYQGMRYDDTSSYICYSCRYEYDYSLTSYYLNFPVLIQYGQYRNKLGLVVKGGIYYALLLTSYHDGYEELYIDPEQGFAFYQIDDNIQPGIFKTVYNGEAESVMNTYDAGIMVGIGGTYAINNKLAFLIEGNLQVGFQSVFENPAMINLMHRAFQIRGGLIYRLTINKIQ